MGTAWLGPPGVAVGAGIMIVGAVFGSNFGSIDQALDERTFLLDGKSFDIDWLGTRLCRDISSQVEKKYLESLKN